MAAYTWTNGDAAPVAAAQLVIRYITDDIDRFVDTNDLASGPAVGAAFTPLVGGLIDDPMARCLSITMFNANSGADRGITILIRGKNQFGVPVQEYVTFASKAINTTNITFTRRAYTHVATITYIARTGGAVQANDRLDVGLATLAGTAAGTHDAANGSAATDYKTVGLPIPVAVSDGFGAVVTGDYPVQVKGLVESEDGTSGVTTTAIIGRGGDFGIDTAYQTIRLDEEFVVTGTGIHRAVIQIVQNNLASQDFGAIEVESMAPAPM